MEQSRLQYRSALYTCRTSDPAQIQHMYNGMKNPVFLLPKAKIHTDFTAAAIYSSTGKIKIWWKKVKDLPAFQSFSCDTQRVRRDQ